MDLESHGDGSGQLPSGQAGSSGQAGHAAMPSHKAAVRWGDDFLSLMKLEWSRYLPESLFRVPAKLEPKIHAL